MPLVFLSHAGGDKPLVDGLFDLLQMGCDLRRTDLFCTSVEGAGIQTGSDFVRWIKANMGDAKLVVLVLTPNFYASRFCLAEMGAAWALEKDVFPLMTPDVARDPGVVFQGKQSARMDSTGLDELRDHVALFHPETAKATARWSLKKDDFLALVGTVMPTLPKPATVDRALLAQEIDRTVAATSMYREGEIRIKQLEEHVRLLEAAKDGDDVLAIRAQMTPALERLDQVSKNVTSQLNDLGRVEVRAVYAAVTNDPWVPSPDTCDTWDTELRKAVKSGWLSEIEPASGPTAYVANEEHPRFISVFEALNDLQATIDEIPDDVRRGLERDAKCLFRIGNWQFWEDQLLKWSLLT